MPLFCLWKYRKGIEYSCLSHLNSYMYVSKDVIIILESIVVCILAADNDTDKTSVLRVVRAATVVCCT